MSRIFPCVFLLTSLCLSVIAQVASEPQPLVSGQPVEREIAAGESHTYQITLTAGQFVRFRLEQRAIDATLILTAPDGKQLVTMNLVGSGGEESLSLEAPTTGSFRLTVRGRGGKIERGSYRLEATVKATATAPDRQRLAAETLLLEIKKLNDEKGSPQQRIDKAQQALSLWRELGELSWAALSLRYIGFGYEFLGQYEKAIHYFEQALALYREAKYQAGAERALYGIGVEYQFLNRHEKAIEYFEQSLHILRELKNRSTEGRLLRQLGVAHYYLSHYETALEYHRQALAISRELQDRELEQLALGSMSIQYVNLSQFEKALEYNEQARLIAQERKDREMEASYLNNRGNIYGNLRRYEKALEYYEHSLSLFREQKNQRGEGLSLNNLGDAYNNLGQHEVAIKYLSQALVILREVKSRGDEGLTLQNLGETYAKLKDYGKATESYEQALAIHREVKNRRLEGSVLSGLGLVQFRRGHVEQSAASLTQAIAILREVGERSVELSALSTLALTERERGNLAQARVRVEECLRIAETLRADLVSPDARTAYLASVQDAYQFYTDLLMRLHQAEPAQSFAALAVEVSERQRARSLLDLLTESRTDLRQGVDAALLERERTLAKQLSTKAQAQTRTPAAAAALKLEISQLETEYERTQSAIRKASPHYAALTQPQPLKLPEIQQQLDADTVLLEYALGPERSYLWAITKDSLTSYELPKEAAIKQNALQVYELLTARSTNKRNETPPDRRDRLAQAEANLPTAAQALSQQILGPVAAQLGNKRLVIVADGALQYIPFAMLPEPVVGGRWSVVGEKEVVGDRQSVVVNNANANRPPTTDHRPPLIVKHEIISLPSASALAIQRTELAGRQPAPKLLAVIADPVFDRTDERLKAAATATSEQAQAVSFNDARSIEHLAGKNEDKASGTTRKMVIPRLPYTRQEATQLLALTPKNTSFSALDFQANRLTALDPALSQYRYVHFATHGLLDSERPGLSSLVLSMVDAQGKAQDGFLRANDIYNLKLPAELVVLSACQTGLGKDIKGEGLVGLTRGFMYAGAARVVVSLWSVNDRATSDLMTRFYQKMLKQGERPAAALRAAQVEMWKQQQWQSPYYWAAFVMQGEWK